MFLKSILTILIILFSTSAHSANWLTDPDATWAVTFDQTTGDMLDMIGTFSGDMDLSFPAPPFRIEGKFFGGANFSGANNYLPFGDVTFMDGLDTWTLNFWLAQSEDYGSLERDIIRKNGTMNVQDSAGIERIYIWTTDHLTGINFTVSSDNAYPSGTYWISEDGNWHMYTITYDGSTITAYRDCVSINSMALTGTVPNSNSKFTLGRKDPLESGIDYVYQGKMDDFLFVKRVINGTECTDLMTNGLDGSAGHHPTMFKGNNIKLKGVKIGGT